jgi:hypothetical protein
MYVLLERGHGAISGGGDFCDVDAWFHKRSPSEMVKELM